jgi:hypothetical protein
MFEPGDRVRVVHGSNLGKSGIVQGWERGKVLVKSEDTGTVRAIAPAWLSPVAVLLSDAIPWDVGVQPLQSETTTEPGFQAASPGLDRIVGAEPLQILTSTPTDSDPSPYDVGAEPLDLLTSTPTYEVEPLQALELLRERLQKTALTKAWLESAGRGYVRLCYHKSVGMAPVYVDAKDVSHWRDRIAAGRALRHCEALIKYLGTLEHGFSEVPNEQEE